MITSLLMGTVWCFTKAWTKDKADRAVQFAAANLQEHWPHPLQSVA